MRFVSLNIKSKNKHLRLMIHFHDSHEAKTSPVTAQEDFRNGPSSAGMCREYLSPGNCPEPGELRHIATQDT